MAGLNRGLLLSGGMDSTAIAYWKRPELAITIDYGQRPAIGEIRAAKAVTDALDIKHVVVIANIADIGSGDLAGRNAIDLAPASEWWPYRNQFLLTVAAMKCITEGVSELMIGALQTDGFHADGTREFIDQFNGLLGLQEGNLIVTTPAIGLNAQELVTDSKIPEDILAWSHSCHVSDLACGFCRGCLKHYSTMDAVYGRPY